MHLSTVRINVENEESWMNYFENGGKVVICAFHQQFFSGIRYFQKFKKYNPSIMISKSKDGEIVAKVAERSGYHVARGSSSRNGPKALKELIERVNETRFAAHIVDGPRGPSGIIKPGLIHLAHATGAAIVPVLISAKKAWTFNSWDRFFVPKPFTKVTLRFEDMVKFEPVQNEDEFEQQRKRLEDIMRPGLRA